MSRSVCELNRPQMVFGSINLRDRESMSTICFIICNYNYNYNFCNSALGVNCNSPRVGWSSVNNCHFAFSLSPSLSSLSLLLLRVTRKIIFLPQKINSSFPTTEICFSRQTFASRELVTRDCGRMNECMDD